jgi:hypothetical protein
MTDLVIRPLTAGEEELFLSMTDPALVGVASTGRNYRECVAAGQYRPEWTWVALRGGRVVARAAWWGGPDDPTPVTLDWFDPGDRPDDGAALLRAAPFGCEYCLVLPPGWRDRPDVRVAAQARIGAAERAGMRPLVERLRYTWTPAEGLPERPGRLAFRPEPDDGVVLDVLRQVEHGTLDAHSRRTIERHGLDAAAREDLDILRWFPSPRDWWRLAYTPSGALVGITVPSRNYASPVIGLIGVVSGQRGHGYGYDLLVEATHMLVEAGEEIVVGETDTSNWPMAAAFARARYQITQERVFLQ